MEQPPLQNTEHTVQRESDPIYAAAIAYAVEQANLRREARLAGVRLDDRRRPHDPIYEAAVVIAVQKTLERWEGNGSLRPNAST